LRVSRAILLLSSTLDSSRDMDSSICVSSTDGGLDGGNDAFRSGSIIRSKRVGIGNGWTGGAELFRDSAERSFDSDTSTGKIDNVKRHGRG